MTEGKNKGIVEKIWELLASVKFAIIIFSIISLTSIVGTILEQGAERSRNINVLTRLFGDTLAPTLYDIFEKLGFMDMYHSWWFVTLLFLFSINIVICSVDRLPRIWKIIREPIQPLTEEHLGRSPIKKELIVKGKPDEVKIMVTSAIKKIGFHVAEFKEDKGYQFFAQKGRFSRFGVYITHLSILLILIGALIGIFFGFKGFLPIPEGSSASIVLLNTGHLTNMEELEKERILNALDASSGNISNVSQQLGVDESSLQAKMHRYGIQPLSFSIRCNDFNVDFYEGSDMPKDFKSWLTVIDNGREVIKKTIEVNNPLTYKGITFYQSSYGMVPNAQGIFVLRITPQSGISETKQLHLNDTFTIPGTRIAGTIIDFSPALSFDRQGRPFTYAEMMNNPAVLIDFKEDGKEKYSGWILKRYQTTWKLPEGHIVEFIDLWGTQYTGLQVRKDPGVWIVYFGCIAISIGLYTAFFMSHRKLWVRIVQDKNNTNIMVGAMTNKNRSGFERKIDTMISLLKKRQEGGR